MKHRTRLLILSVVTLAIVIIGLALFHYIPDDTFITLRNARNVLHGEGFVFNPGERVEGYTNASRSAPSRFSASGCTASFRAKRQSGAVRRARLDTTPG